MISSLDDARRMFAAIARPGDVFELRSLVRINGQQHITSGYFDDLDELARAAMERSGKDDGVYVTINPVNPALLARAPKNRMRRAGSGDTTSDRDVRTRRSILVDIDPVRPAGISSSDAEHESALELAKHIREALGEIGWPDPIFADSGNGAHLIYAVDLAVDDGGLVRRILAELHRRYSTATLKVDEKVFNPARIGKVYGTLTRKGEDTPERPHRVARILEVPDRLVEVPLALLSAFAPATGGVSTRPLHASIERREFDIDAWMSEHLPGAKERPWAEGRKWLLPVCPFNDGHDRGEAYVCQLHSGALAAGCQHDSCQWSWRELRDRFEPNRPSRNGNGNGTKISHREPPPEVMYEDSVEADPASIPPVAAPPPWRKASDLVDEIWNRRNEEWTRLAIANDEIARIRPGGIAVVIGGSGSGKSSLVSNLLLEHAKNAGPAIALSIELPADELAARIVGIRCDAGWEQALRGQVPREHMEDALNLPRLYILERKHATLENLSRTIDAARLEHPNEPVLAAVDYAQLIRSKEREMRQRVSEVFERIDDVTRDKRVTTIAVSQMGRAQAKQARDGEKIGAESADLGAESAAIERFATVTLTIGKAGEPREDGSREVELSIGKARMGEGDRVIPMSYFGRAGTWRVAGAAQSAAKVRTDRDQQKAEQQAASVKNQLIGAAQTSKLPLSREQLQGMVVGNKKAKLAAITAMLGTGELVEVTRRVPRSRLWSIWTPDRARDAGIQLVSDMPEDMR